MCAFNTKDTYAGGDIGSNQIAVALDDLCPCKIITCIYWLILCRGHIRIRTFCSAYNNFPLGCYIPYRHSNNIAAYRSSSGLSYSNAV